MAVTSKCVHWINEQKHKNQKLQVYPSTHINHYSQYDPPTLQPVFSLLKRHVAVQHFDILLFKNVNKSDFIEKKKRADDLVLIVLKEMLVLFEKTYNCKNSSLSTFTYSNIQVSNLSVVHSNNT